MDRIRLGIALVSALFLSLTVLVSIAHGDSVATQVNLSGVSFSSAVTPMPVPNGQESVIPVINATYSAGAQAWAWAGSQRTVAGTAGGIDTSSTFWSATSTVEEDSSDYATASVSPAQLSAVAVTAPEHSGQQQGFSDFTQAVVSGAITASPSGTVTISVPYTAVLNFAGCCSDLESGVEILLSTSAGELNPAGVETFNYSSGSGVLTLSETALVPGATYYFDIDAYSGSFFTSTPEPATLLLLGTGLVALAGLSLRKRLA